jgi:hypothetical protein
VTEERDLRGSIKNEYQDAAADRRENRLRLSFPLINYLEESNEQARSLQARMGKT